MSSPSRVRMFTELGRFILARYVKPEILAIPLFKSKRFQFFGIISAPEQYLLPRRDVRQREGADAVMPKIGHSQDFNRPLQLFAHAVAQGVFYFSQGAGVGTVVFHYAKNNLYGGKR